MTCVTFVLNEDRPAILSLFNSLEVLSSASVKQNYLLKMLLLNLK